MASLDTLSPDEAERLCRFLDQWGRTSEGWRSHEMTKAMGIVAMKSRIITGLAVGLLAAGVVFAVTRSWESTLIGVAVGIILGFALGRRG